MTTEPVSPPRLPPMPVAALTLTVPASLLEIEATIQADWQAARGTQRLWARDPALWTGGDEARWLGWLDSPEVGIARLPLLAGFARDVFEGEYEHVLLLGMGGSSLGPEVVAKVFGHQEIWPEMHVLDSTDPRQIRAVEDAIDYATTLFIVSSKSGGTLEVSILLEYFLSRAQAVLGQALAKRQFVAITDPGSRLEGIAKTTGFNHVFAGDPTVGGRFSVLSPFGLVPATAIGVDLARYLFAAHDMAEACRDEGPANPGVRLGALIAAAVQTGHDKLTIVAGPGLESFGGWVEQLVAESTGKNGQAVIPVDGEPLGSPDVYGSDRLFVHLVFADRPDSQAEKLDQLAAAGIPVLRISLASPYQLGQEFFRWELATAVLGAAMKLNPFDQPDVEASKVATKRLTATYAASGDLPGWGVLSTAPGINLLADPANTATLLAAAAESTVLDVLRAHFGRVRTGDYVAILAYLPHDEAVTKALQAPRLKIRDRLKVATCLQFGPRFLHSTGQAYKGGPNTGVFIVITTDEPDDLAVPGEKYSFGLVKAAQAQGDSEVLAQRGRRLLRIHLTGNLARGLASIAQMIDTILT